MNMQTQPFSFSGQLADKVLPNFPIERQKYKRQENTSLMRLKPSNMKGQENYVLDLRYRITA